jgi:uncharacterized membrane protein YfcA
VPPRHHGQIRVVTAIGWEQFLGFVGLGVAVGAYGTLIGAGGGFILMPLLLLWYPRESASSLTAVSLAVVFFNASSGSLAYARMQRIDYRSGLMFAAAATPGAVVGALHTALISRPLFNLVFSVVMIAAALIMVVRPELQHSSRKHRPSRFLATRRLVEADGTGHEWSFYPLVGIVLSFFVGYFSSFLGIGGGIIHVPALVWFLNFPVHIATATSHFILAIMALAGTLTHVWTGSLHHQAREVLALGLGALVGAQIGARLSKRIKASWIIRSLALALVLVGARILLATWPQFWPHEDNLFKQVQLLP